MDFLCIRRPRCRLPQVLILKSQFMEQINRIELRGLVGSVNTQSYPQGKVSHFTVATNYAYKDKNGAPVIETTWHNVTAWENKGMADLDRLGKGSKVYVCGRLRIQKFTGSDGVERTNAEIQASRVVLIDDSEMLNYEM